MTMSYGIKILFILFHASFQMITFGYKAIEVPIVVSVRLSVNVSIPITDQSTYVIKPSTCVSDMKVSSLRAFRSQRFKDSVIYLFYLLV